MMASTQNNLAIATFAGGCFWCTEASFSGIKGVVCVVSGYSGGDKANPCYDEVCQGLTGHREAVQVTFDPSYISYRELLEIFFKQIDPTQANGQFFDQGSQYKTAIFYHDKEQQDQAELFRKSLEQKEIFQDPIVTEILSFKNFYPAEEYHQAYHVKNPKHYLSYKKGSGREEFFKRIWKGEDFNPLCPLKSAQASQDYAKPSLADIKKKLTSEQYRITQENGTEPPFANTYWDYKKEGIYVDVVSGEPLFASSDKFDSKSGWPSFTKPLAPDHIFYKNDMSLGVERVEVRSKKGDSHLGHVFKDGPAPQGLRFCINSGALRFIAKQDLAREGYGQYLKYFL